MNANVEKDVIISYHARKRCKRVNMKFSTLERFSKIAIQCVGEWTNYPSAVAEYCRNKLFNNSELGNQLSIYKDTIFIFDNCTVVTHYPLPKNLSKLI